LYKLSDLRWVDTNDIDLASDEFQSVHIATAVRITKDFLEKGIKPAAIIVVKHPHNGRLVVRGNGVALCVAHALGIKRVAIQEVLPRESDPGVREEGTSAGSVCCP